MKINDYHTICQVACKVSVLHNQGRIELQSGENAVNTFIFTVCAKLDYAKSIGSCMPSHCFVA